MRKKEDEEQKKKRKESEVAERKERRFTIQFILVIMCSSFRKFLCVLSESGVAEEKEGGNTKFSSVQLYYVNPFANSCVYFQKVECRERKKRKYSLVILC